MFVVSPQRLHVQIEFSKYTAVSRCHQVIVIISASASVSKSKNVSISVTVNVIVCVDVSISVNAIVGVNASGISKGILKV